MPAFLAAHAFFAAIALLFAEGPSLFTGWMPGSGAEGERAGWLKRIGGAGGTRART